MQFSENTCKLTISTKSVMLIAQYIPCPMKI
jgi:hypothetical protein